MKILGKNSLSSVLATVINVVWWLEWTAAIVLIGLASITAHVRRKFALQIPINFSSTNLAQVHSVNQKLPGGLINTKEGTFSMHIDANWQNNLMLLIGYGVIFSTIIIITYQLKKIFENFKQGLPFNKLNMVRIRNIAFVLMGYSFVQWLFAYVVNALLNLNFQFGHLDLTYNFNISYLLTGVALLVVEEIFKTGLLLEEQQQLTI
ncbi:MAG: DUF2975 domain-containing protein [Sphingobacteriaceae bacterium]|nr:MAG: DUF2975 domain-containing protein [Sphingobacteriaceae bacterium]